MCSNLFVACSDSVYPVIQNLFFLQLLKSDQPKSSSFWTFEYYQSFFDVDTKDVADRILGSMFPDPRSNYLVAKIRPNPDLYGK